MSAPLRGALEDLVTHVPEHVLPDSLADDARSAGARRRRTRWLTLVGMAVIAAVVAGLAVGPIERQLTGPSPATGEDTAGETTVMGYPQRIGRQWWVRELPDRPGPMAGLLGRSADLRWRAVDADGAQWALRQDGRALDTFPTLSPDGRWLGYLTGDDHGYLLHDLVDGERVRFPEIGTGATYDDGPAQTPAWQASQSPSFWSPDATRVAVLGGLTRSPDPSAGFVLGTDGSQQRISRRPGFLAGWGSNTTLIWIRGLPGRAGGPAIRVVTSDTTGVEQTSSLVRVSRRVAENVHQWSGHVSPDLTRLALVTEDTPWDGLGVRTVSLVDGGVGRPVRAEGYFPCSIGWAGSTILIPSRVTVNRVDPVGRTTTPLVTMHQPSDGGCLQLAADGVLAGPTPSFLGDATAWWSWWWRELLLGALAAGLAALLLAVRRRRRGMTHTPGSE